MVETTSRLPKKIVVDPQAYEINYRARDDILTLCFGGARGGLAYDIGGVYWLFADPDSGVATMAEVEHFQRVFLPQYSSFLANLWRERKRDILRKNGRREAEKWNDVRHDFVWKLRDVLQHLLEEHPPKVELPAVANPLPR